MKVVEITSLNAAALYAFNSTINFFRQNIFANNTITNGGAMMFRDSVVNFFGSSSFISNTAKLRSHSSAGAINCVNSKLSFNGSTLFKHNLAIITTLFPVYSLNTGGAILALSLSKLTFGVSSNTTFTGNRAAYEGGALSVYNSELVIEGGVLFERNFALQRGGAIYASSSDVKLEKVHFERNVAMYGGAVNCNNSNVSIMSSKFIRNPSFNYAGAVYIAYSTVVFDKQNIFEENHANYAGAIMVFSSRATFYGENRFVNNRGFKDSEGLILLLSNITISGQSTFHNNHGGTGGAIHGYRSSLTINGNSSFMANTADLIFGRGIHFSNGTLSIVGQASFVKNGAVSAGSALYIKFSNITISGNVSISDGNSSKAKYSILQGAIGLFNSRMILTDTGHLLLTNNTADEGGAINVWNSEIEFNGCIQCYNNQAYSSGGALFARKSMINLKTPTNCSIFQSNIARNRGGGVYAIDSLVNMTGLQNFVQNCAQYGGALAFDYSSNLILSDPLQAHFVENDGLEGGAIYYEDSFSRSQCIHVNSSVQQDTNCFFELTSKSDIQLSFVNNTASNAGTVLYGGSIDACKLYIGDSTRDSCGNRVGEKFIYGDEVIKLFNSILHIVSKESKPSNKSSEISSDSLQLCFCRGTNLECENQEIKTIRGKEFTLMAVIVGQNKGIIPSAVRTSLDNSIQISASQRVQRTGKECTPTSYRLSSDQNTTTLSLFPDGPCRDITGSRRGIHVSFLPCPDAFVLDGSECVCEERLLKYTTNCSVDNDSIERGMSKFWMGAVYDNESFEGLILHSSCPFDYCVTTPVSIKMDNLDVQCNHNHSGVLCGSCDDDFSIAFGTLHCLPCSNDYLALIIPFALAGVVLVAFLLLLQLSVAAGTINGLIFYANVVQINRYIFFPPETFNMLTIFIAWVNLDLGIETCFYDGMNTYAFTWLQFLFPFYVWFLMGLMIVLSHYFDMIAKALGKNPVAALATLFLLSYSKILRTVIVALSFTRLDYPDSTTKVVWLYDGNVPYFQRVDHIILGAFALAVLFILFLPYTFLLLGGHWLLHYSDSVLFSWLNKIKPFMDAYYAPYKKETHYWIGITLLVRCILFLIFAFNALGNASVNLLAITSVMAGLAVLAWIHNQLYEKLYNDILEASFILN